MEREAKFELTGFGDEISPELSEQLDTLSNEGVSYLELRGIWGKNVLDLEEADVERAREQLKSRGMAVSAIASPIGKVPLDADFDEHFARFQRALKMARAFETRYVRIFSFYPPENEARVAGQGPVPHRSPHGGQPTAGHETLSRANHGTEDERYRDEVVRRLSLMAQLAYDAGVVLLHENDEELFGETPERGLEIMKAVASSALRTAFDPGNYVQIGVRPLDQAYPLLADYVEYVHIKDAVLSDGTMRLPGKGDGQIPELLAALKARGYRGFLSLEPHLTADGKMSGFSGPVLFAEAIRALKELIAVS